MIAMQGNKNGAEKQICLGDLLKKHACVTSPIELFAGFVNKKNPRTCAAAPNELTVKKVPALKEWSPSEGPYIPTKEDGRMSA
jgi:hypothetical protein